MTGTEHTGPGVPLDVPSRDSLRRVASDVVACTRCPRLRAWCVHVARTKRAAYRDQEYWGLPIPGFGDPDARVLLLGLAPGAHGANRTGRIFTGDRSGDFLFGSLYRTGFANQPESVARTDDLRLTGAWISASARCAPPGNRPAPEEIRNCLPYFCRELLLLRNASLVVALGGIAFQAAFTAFAMLGIEVPRPRTAFGHGVLVPGGRADHALPARPAVLASYHPSQQNTQTGRLTAPMFDRIFRTARDLAGL